MASTETFLLVGPTATTTQADELIIRAPSASTSHRRLAHLRGGDRLHRAAGASVTPGYLGIYPEYRTVNTTGAYSADGDLQQRQPL